MQSESGSEAITGPLNFPFPEYCQESCSPLSSCHLCPTPFLSLLLPFPGACVKVVGFCYLLKHLSVREQTVSSVRF